MNQDVTCFTRVKNLYSPPPHPHPDIIFQLNYLLSITTLRSYPTTEYIVYQYLSLYFLLSISQSIKMFPTKIISLSLAFYLSLFFYDYLSLPLLLQLPSQITVTITLGLLSGGNVLLQVLGGGIIDRG